MDHTSVPLKHDNLEIHENRMGLVKKSKGGLVNRSGKGQAKVIYILYESIMQTIIIIIQNNKNKIIKI